MTQAKEQYISAKQMGDCLDSGELTLYFCLGGPRQDAEEMCGSEGGIQEG